MKETLQKSYKLSTGHFQGVEIHKLKRISVKGGDVQHYLKSTDPGFLEFGEIYFSCTNPSAIKAWHLHKKMTLNYAVIYGEIKCVLFDDRPNSKTKGCIDEFFLSPENYCLITVPPLVWNGFKGIGNKVSIGGQAGVSGHLRIGNNVKIGGGSGVVNNVEDNQVVMGYPAVSLKNFLKNKKK